MASALRWFTVSLTEYSNENRKIKSYVNIPARKNPWVRTAGTRSPDYSDKDDELPWLSYQHFGNLVGNLTDLIVLEQNWQLMIDEIWNTRQVNDYTGKNINKKDFMRSWTHSRTAQHISFDELLEEGTTVDGELLFDIADPRSEFESEIIHKFYMEDFKAQLPGVDSKILQMRYDGHSLKEIAAAVGFKTPSAVSKHVEKIAERYDNFISDEYGKLLSKCIN